MHRHLRCDPSSHVPSHQRQRPWPLTFVSCPNAVVRTARLSPYSTGSSDHFLLNVSMRPSVQPRLPDGIAICQTPVESAAHNIASFLRCNMKQSCHVAEESGVIAYGLGFGPACVINDPRSPSCDVLPPLPAIPASSLAPRTATSRCNRQRVGSAPGISDHSARRDPDT